MNRTMMIMGRSIVTVPTKAVTPPLPHPPPTDLDAGVVGVGLAPRRVGQQYVLGLQVPVDDALAVEDLHGACDLLQEHADGVLT